MKYRKKPVEIEAFEYDGTDECLDNVPWIMEALENGEVGRNSQGLHIKTLEGVMTASVGDWVLKGVKGEIYPCKPDIFEMTYEKVD